MARFLRWLDAEAPKGRLTEITAAIALEVFRLETGALKDISFDTISAAGPNAALPHYRVTEASDRRLNAAYTSSIPAASMSTAPRTSRAPSPSASERRDGGRFHARAQGHDRHLARRLSEVRQRARSSIPSRARRSGRAGFDFDHERAMASAVTSASTRDPSASRSSARRRSSGHDPLQRPGYYKAGHFGIRIENLVLVEERPIRGANGQCSASRR